MTNRSSTEIGWATDGVSQVADAELDTTHPSGNGGAGKTVKGWVSETEPQEWENFNLRLRESRLESVMANGMIPWDAEVNYKVDAITYESGINYVALSANLGKTPSTQPTFWSPIKFPTEAIHTTTIADMQNKRTIHIPAGQNSHSDDITSVSIGGSYKATIDSQNNVVSADNTAHMNRLNNPHSSTPSKVGALPYAGGDFTGRVNYLDNISLGSDGELMTNATTFVAFRSKVGAIGLGVSDYHTGGKWQRIITEANFPDVKALYNNTYVLPEADLHFPMLNDLLDVDKVESITLTRNSTLSYTDRNKVVGSAAINTPAFEVAGLKLTAATALNVNAQTGLFGARDGCISFTLNGAVVVKDVQFTSANLMDYFGATTGNVKNFKVWSQRLTPKQKLSIPI